MTGRAERAGAGVDVPRRRIDVHRERVRRRGDVDPAGGERPAPLRGVSACIAPRRAGASRWWSDDGLDWERARSRMTSDAQYFSAGDHPVQGGFIATFLAQEEAPRMLWSSDGRSWSTSMAVRAPLSKATAAASSMSDRVLRFGCELTDPEVRTLWVPRPSTDGRGSVPEQAPQRRLDAVLEVARRRRRRPAPPATPRAPPPASSPAPGAPRRPRPRPRRRRTAPPTARAPRPRPPRPSP